MRIFTSTRALLMLAAVLPLPATAEESKIIEVPKVGEYEKVQFVKIEGTYVRFLHKNGAGRMLISSLPQDIQEKLKSLPKVDLAAKEAAENALKINALKTTFIEDAGGKISGRVIQVLDDGVLMAFGSWTPNKATAESKTVHQKLYVLGSANFGRSARYSLVPRTKIEMVRKTEIFSPETMFYVITNPIGMYEGKLCTIEVLPIGTYTYETVSHTIKTIRKFCSDPDTALRWLLDESE